MSNRRNFFLSRRVVSPDGVFLGVLAAPIDASRFAMLFDNARFSKEASISLIHESGRMIARSPLFEASFGQSILQSELYRHLPQSPTGSYVTVSVVDKQRRVFSYRSFDDYPLVLTAGVSAETWNAELKRDLLAATAGFLSLLAILAAGGHVALRSYAHLERNEQRQRRLVGELQEAETQLSAKETVLRAVTDHIPAMVSYLDLEQRFVFNNARHEQWLERPLDEVTGRTMADLYDPASLRMHQKHFFMARDGATSEFEFTREHHGRTLHFAATYVPQFGAGGEVVGVCSMIHDITARKRIEMELSQLVRFDALTGLPNRRQLDELLPKAIARAARSQQVAALLFLDLDRFKQVNDRLGHHAGDLVLKEFARRLQACVRSTDMVVRLSGDEFVIVLEALNDAADVDQVTDKIFASMAESIDIDGERCAVQTSIGVATFRDDRLAAEAIMRKADEALYMAKAAGRNTVVSIAV